MIWKRKFYYLLIAVLAIQSCQKDLDVFVPDIISGPDNTWYNSINNTMPVSQLKTAILLDKHIDSFELTNNIVTLTAASGLQCKFTAGSILNGANIPVTGKIYLETMLLKEKGNFIRMGIPTVSNGKMLVSGGAFFIRLTKDGNELHLSQNAPITIRFNDPNPSFLMKKFDGDESNPNGFNWIPNTDTANNRVSVLNQSMYEIQTNQLRWINCDYFYDTTGIPQTVLSTILPSNYTNANTMAFTVFNDLRSVVGMYGNATTRKFSTGRLPVNKQVTVVVISKQGNDYFMGHEQVLTTVGSAGTTGNQQVTITPVITTLDNMKTYLNSL